jgi:hypothetical protein
VLKGFHGNSPLSIEKSKVRPLQVKGQITVQISNSHCCFFCFSNPDTKIRIGGKQFPCHAIALQCCSKYFDKLGRPKDKVMEVEIPEVFN